MFGYIVPNEPELKIKEYQEYRGVYCGLCQRLKKKYGPPGQLCLNNDMTFMAMLHMGLYEEEEAGKSSMYRCKLHPTRKLRIYLSDCLDYAADMTVLLSYYLARDHWADDKDVRALAQMGTLRHHVRKIAKRYPRQAHAVKFYVKRLDAAEKARDKNLDRLAGLTGTMFGEIMNWKDDIWSGMLKRLGFYLGKFIYLMDAYEDLDKDIEKHRFNPLIPYSYQSDYEERVYGMLNMMMADCAQCFEQLPITFNIEIMRNILYAGVWSNYMKVRNGKNKTEEIKDESL